MLTVGLGVCFFYPLSNKSTDQTSGDKGQVSDNWTDKKIKIWVKRDGLISRCLDNIKNYFKSPPFLCLRIKKERQKRSIAHAP